MPVDEWPMGVDGGESEPRLREGLITEALWKVFKGFGCCVDELGSLWRILAC